MIFSFGFINVSWERVIINVSWERIIINIRLEMGRTNPTKTRLSSKNPSVHKEQLEV